MSAGSLKSATTIQGSPSPLVALDFEIHGKVQGVFFRKHTQKECQRLGISGWVMNTTHKTVVGHAEGSKSSIEDLKRWLKTTGSPKSRIEKADFKLEKPLTRLSSKEFFIRR